MGKKIKLNKFFINKTTGQVSVTLPKKEFPPKKIPEVGEIDIKRWKWEKEEEE